MTLPAAGPEISQFVAGAIKDRGIELRAEQSVQAIDADSCTVSFTDGGQLEYTLLLAVPRAVPPQVVADSPLAGEGGWIQPDRETLRTRFEGVYAAGDCTATPPRKAGIFAEAESRVAARNIAAEIDGGLGDSRRLWSPLNSHLLAHLLSLRLLSSSINKRLSLFTVLRGIGILRSSNPRSCIAPPGQA